MRDGEDDSVQRQTDRNESATDANHPLLRWLMAHVHPERATVSGDVATQAAGAERDDAVVELAEALRAAERAHRAYEAELCLGDVAPADDWSVWYAEYLLGLR